MTLFGGMMFLCLTNGITSVLFDIGLPVNIALVIIYEINKKYGHMEIIVIILRVTAIVIFALSILAPLTLINFRHTKLVYPIKRFCYGYGVYAENFNNDILPESLPKKCDDYMFFTQGSIPAQDYHASAYLAFHTDTAALKIYENHYNSLNNAERHTATFETYEVYDSHAAAEHNLKQTQEQKNQCPKELPQHVFQRLESEHIYDFSNAVIYIIPSYYNKGCMLDYDSGLAVFWY